jgi:pilus assembly protein CpaB
MKKLLKNRTLIGVLCIFLSLVICFGLTPLFNSAMTAQTEIARVKSEIKKGELITADKLETVKVGSYNLPSDVLKKTSEISGKYALADLQKGDYVLSTKLSATPLAEFEYLSTLDGTKQAMSITIKSFAAGLSGKLEAGDIVTLIAADYGDTRETTIPPELQYVYVLAVTTEKGVDKEYAADNAKTDNTESGDDEQELPSTITVLVCPTQEKLLADLENKGKLHVALVYRGSKEQAQKFLDVQDKYIAGLQKGSETPGEDTIAPGTTAIPNEAQGGNAQ